MRRVLSWAKTHRILAGIIAFLAVSIVVGAINSGTGKTANTAAASTPSAPAARAPAPTMPATSAPAKAPSATTMPAAARPAVPVNGGSYANADTVLTRLASAGLLCPGPSPMANANVFYPGATSLTACDSPGGKTQDTSAQVFDTAAHVAQYVSDVMGAPLDATAMLTGVNWTLDSTNFGYVQRARAVLGGKLSYAAASTTEPSTGPALTAAQQAFAGEMTAAGFESGTPAWILDADGEAVCGGLQTQSMALEIAYEESVDENQLTGMTSNADILKFVRWSVQAWCPQYGAELPN